MLTPSLVALFGVFKFVMTGASKVRDCIRVPTEAETVTFSETLGPPPSCISVPHRTVVVDNQELEPHACDLRRIVGEVLLYPKFRPVIVTDEPPEATIFGTSSYETTGASKLKIEPPVPTSEATVRIGRSPKPDNADAVRKQLTVVAELHAVVWH
jgi:hypothetical protein